MIWSLNVEYVLGNESVVSCPLQKLALDHSPQMSAFCTTILALTGQNAGRGTRITIRHCLPTSAAHLGVEAGLPSTGPFRVLAADKWALQSMTPLSGLHVPAPTFTVGAVHMVYSMLHYL